MSAVVTGGAGFIGSHLAEALVNSGHHIRVLDDFSTGRHDNLSRLIQDLELIEGSILDPEKLRQAMAGVEVVFHQAAIPSVPRSVRNPILSNEVNITGTLNVLVAACDAVV